MMPRESLGGVSAVRAVMETRDTMTFRYLTISNALLRARSSPPPSSDRVDAHMPFLE